MESTDTRTLLEKQLRSATGPWEKLPILIALAKELNDPNFAYGCAVEALSVAKELNDPFWIACSLRELAAHRMRLSRLFEAIKDLKQSSNLFAQINDPRNRSFTDLRLAQALIAAGEFTEALQMLLHLREIFKSLSDYRAVSNVYCYLGEVHKTIGDHGAGLKYYHRAISIAHKLKNTKDLGLFYIRLATAYHVMGNSEKYRKYAFKSLSFNREANHLAGIAIALGNIANSYIDQSMFAEAEKYVKLSGRIYRKLGYVALEATSWGRLGRIYQAKGDIDKAYRCHRKGLALSRNSEQVFVLGTLYVSFGGFCVTTERFRQGISYIKKAVAIMDEHGSTHHRHRAYEILTNAYERVGDTAQALETHRQYVRVKEEYINNQKFFEASRLEIRLRLKALTQHLKKERSENINLKKQIEDKEAELVSLTLNLIQEEELRKKEEAPLKRTLPQSKAAPVVNSNWEIFARQFHKVHHDFYDTLLRKYSTLTPTELKISSLIRIGLSTKDIADILCIAKRTVDTHRVHIHKKMNLPQGASLSAYIACL